MRGVGEGIICAREGEIDRSTCSSGRKLFAVGEGERELGSTLVVMLHTIILIVLVIRGLTDIEKSDNYYD